MAIRIFKVIKSLREFMSETDKLSSSLSGVVHFTVRSACQRPFSGYHFLHGVVVLEPFVVRPLVGQLTMQVVLMFKIPWDVPKQFQIVRVFVQKEKEPAVYFSSGLRVTDFQPIGFFGENEIDQIPLRLVKYGDGSIRMNFI